MNMPLFVNRTTILTMNYSNTMNGRMDDILKMYFAVSNEFSETLDIELYIYWATKSE